MIDRKSGIGRSKIVKEKRRECYKYSRPKKGEIARKMGRV